MLTIGKLLTDEQGRIGARRVVSVESGAARVETSFETGGIFHGVRYGNLVSYLSIFRPNGTLSSELQGALRTVDNDTAVWRGISVGQFLDEKEHSRTYRGTLAVENADGVLSELNGVLAVFELEIDDDNKVRFRTWTLA